VRFGRRRDGARRRVHDAGRRSFTNPRRTAGRAGHHGQRSAGARRAFGAPRVLCRCRSRSAGVGRRSSRRDSIGRGRRGDGSGRRGPLGGRDRSLGRRLARRGRSQERSRQELQRIEVALRLRGDADPQVNVRLRQLDLARRADRPHAVTLGERRALGDRDRAKVGQRDGVPVGRRDRETLARGRDGAREGHRPGRGRDDARARGRADVDAAMRARRVRMCGIELELLEDRPIGRPGPGTCRRCQKERGGNSREQNSAHGSPLRSTTY
jgi:hypothetical protein